MTHAGRETSLESISSSIFTKKVLSLPAENIIYSGVSRKHDDDLATYLREKLNNIPGLTLRGIEERSGKTITHSYLSKLLSGAASNPSRDKLKALAKGLGVSEDEVFAAARGKTPADDPNFDKTRFGQMALKFDRLRELGPVDARVNVTALIDLLDRELDRMLEEEQRKASKKKK